MGDDIRKLKAAAGALKGELASYEGVEDIQDSYRPAKKEFRLSLKDGARQLGIQLSDLARQTRAAFWGEEALKIQRGRDEVIVRVRYPEHGKAEPGDLENMKIMTSSGAELPFYQVADIEEYQGPAIIERIHRKRAITVTADVDEEKANADQIVDALSRNFFNKLREAYPGIVLLTEGQKKEARESLGSLKTGFLVAVLMIYVLLVNQFRTYTPSAYHYGGHTVLVNRSGDRPHGLRFGSHDTVHVRSARPRRHRGKRLVTSRSCDQHGAGKWSAAGAGPVERRS